MHSKEDIDYIEALPIKTLRAFRSTVLSSWALQMNPEMPSHYDWVDIKQLKAYLAQSTDIGALIIKSEPQDTSSVPATTSALFGSTIIKREEDDTPSPLGVTRSYREIQDGVIEILDSESDEDVVSPPRLSYSSTHPKKDYAGTFPLSIKDAIASPSVPAKKSVVWEPSSTVWLDEGITSEVCTSHQEHGLTGKATVKRLERLTAIPSVWPVLKSTAFLVQYGDKYVVDKEHTIDGIVLDLDNDSWVSRPGASSSETKSMVTPWPGASPVLCRTARHECRGCRKCRSIDDDILGTPRRELDTSTRDTLLAGVRNTRQDAGSTPTSTAATFLSVIFARKCKAVDLSGTICGGSPQVRSYRVRS
ncbi:hypothetical protein AAF712_006654 [Marasmius tenuissimus]|uniref:Uncharacterized protein n=1 Tax=Marasmius tenuissimus TaxID=585030 RepID=A0ABR2ZYP9_9AGAR